MSHFKKTLIISSYAPPSISGASIMMYNLLKYFPSESVVFLTSHADINDKALAVGNKLSAKFFYYDTLTLATTAQSEGSFFQKLKKFLKKNPWLRYLVHQAMIFYLPFNIVRYGRKIVKDEKIELLVGYSDQGTAFLATYILHLLTRKPYYLYFYDLWGGNNFSFTYKLLARLFEPIICKGAQKVFVMNDVLGEYYERKYHRDVVVIYNSIPIGETIKPEAPINASGVFKIIFTGAIYWAQAGAIRNLIRAVNGVTDANVQFWIYTTYTKEALHAQGIFEGEKVFFATGAPAQMPVIQKSADILFVGLSFDSGYPLLINTSSPGKTYEYMLSGRPILVHAPRQSYISQYAKKHEFAAVVDESDIYKLQDAIKKLIINKEFVSKITDNAFATALHNHDDKKSSEFFQSFFIR